MDGGERYISWRLRYLEPQLSEFVVSIVYEYHRLLHSQLDYSDQSAIRLRILRVPL